MRKNVCIFLSHVFSNFSYTFRVVLSVARFEALGIIGLNYLLKLQVRTAEDPQLFLDSSHVIVAC